MCWPCCERGSLEHCPRTAVLFSLQDLPVGAVALEAWTELAELLLSAGLDDPDDASPDYEEVDLRCSL